MRTFHTPQRTALQRFTTIGLAGLIALGSAGVARAESQGDRAPAPPKQTTPFDLKPAPAPPDPGPGRPNDWAGLENSGLTLSNVKVQPHGTYARFDYTTNADSVSIRITQNVPRRIGGIWRDPIMDSIIGPEQVDGSGKVKYYERFLFPATTYYYIITVPTADNQVPVQAVGSFTTQHRTLTITLDSIHVTDDSDPGAKGAGDFTFWVRADGKPVASFSRDISSDSTYVIALDANGKPSAGGKPLTIVIPDVKDNNVPLDVQVFENDIQSWDDCDGMLLGGDAWNGVAIDDENKCGTWLSLHTEYDASPGIYGPGVGYRENEPIQFVMHWYNSSVHLTISGTMTATWG